MHFALRWYFLPVPRTELSRTHQVRMPRVLWGSSSAALGIRRRIPIPDPRASEFRMEEQRARTTLIAGVLLQGQVPFAL